MVDLRSEGGGSDTTWLDHHFGMLVHRIGAVVKLYIREREREKEKEKERESLSVKVKKGQQNNTTKKGVHVWDKQTHSYIQTDRESETERDTKRDEERDRESEGIDEP